MFISLNVLHLKHDLSICIFGRELHSFFVTGPQDRAIHSNYFSYLHSSKKDIQTGFSIAPYQRKKSYSKVLHILAFAVFIAAWPDKGP